MMAGIFMDYMYFEDNRNAGGSNDGVNTVGNMFNLL